MKYGLIERLPNVDLEDRHVYIWGTGNTSVLYQEGLKRERWLNIYGYAVNDEKQFGKVFFGKKIYSPDEVISDGKAIVLVCSEQPHVFMQIKKQMEESNIEAYYIDEIIFEKNKEKLYEVIDSLNDEKSIKTYLNLIESRINCHFPDEKYVERHQYSAIPAFSMINESDVFIDCGAFVGDSIEQFLWDHSGTFNSLIGVEPDANNFKALNCRVKRLKQEWAISDDRIKLLNCGVSDKPSIANVKISSVGNLGSQLEEISKAEESTGDDIEIVSIDSLMGDKKYTFLKADIESWEYKMLVGAQNSIAKWRPRICVCIYHNATDFYSLPLLLKKIIPDYKLSIRHHSYKLCETVLYAW